MSQYESFEPLLSFLDVPNMPHIYWSDSSGWIMAEFMYDVVKEEIKAEVHTASYVVLTCDETTIVDNGSWMSIHAYTYKNSVRMPFLIGLEKVVEAPSVDHFMKVILQALERGGVVLCKGCHKEAFMLRCRRGYYIPGDSNWGHCAVAAESGLVLHWCALCNAQSEPCGQNAIGFERGKAST
jgi:hypothetical protein